jgi:hypothetical protein
MPSPPQLEPVPQVPQPTVRETPQLSNAVSEPHSAVFRAQKAASDSGVHEHA